ncbi:non-ribosomal peptide synthetase [Xylariaceae sp. FL0594]|nr:non-ribosomal peptide synthetase [Xylariaceae sp. FL0594]
MSLPCVYSPGMQEGETEAGKVVGRAPRSVCDLVDDWTRRQPDHPAVLCGSKITTYQQLTDASSRLARLLIAKKVRPGDIIPVLATRTCEMVVSFLGVLKTGACYAPIDIEAWGEGRIKATLERVSARVVINLGSSSYPGYDVVSLHDVEAAYETDSAHLPESAGELPQKNIKPSDLLYIVFTSGTTSKPKGVMIPHSALLNYVTQGDEEAPFNTLPRPEDKSLLTYSPGFDAATGIIFSTLCNGAQLMVASIADFESCAAEATILTTTPSMLSAIRNISECSSIRTLITGGEPIHPRLIEKWAAPGRTFYNGYGPTETTVSIIMGKVEHTKPVTLGRVMSNSAVFLLDGDTESDYGEICLTGPGLAVGYYQDAALTAQKFVYWHGRRIYRTGDFARRTEHGLEYAGRADSFVKNRGFLVNLDSQVIPPLLSEDVQSATAFMFRDQLVAFVEPETIDTQALRQTLSEKHDAFLVPDLIRAVPTIPLTANGKADNRSLQLLLEAETSRETEDNDSKSKVLPRQSTLAVLKRAISEAIPQTGSDVPDDCSFFELGGNSLAALKVLSYLRRNNLRLGIRDLFNQPCLLAVSSAIEEDSLKKTITTIKSVVSKDQASGHEDGPDVGPMTFLQAKMIQASLKTPGANTMLLRIHIPHQDSELDNTGLREAWRKVFNKYTIFRTTFDLKDDLQYAARSGLELDWSEEVITPDQLNDTIEARSLEIRAEMLKAKLQGGIFTPVNMFHLITVPRSKSVLLFSAHHAQADGWSFSIMLDEAQALLEGRLSSLQRNSPDFIRIALAQRAKSADREETQFWSGIFDSCSDLPNMALPRPPSTQIKSEWSRSTRLDLGFTLEDLEKAAQVLRVMPSALVYVAWGLVMSNYTSSDRIAFGAVFTGRNLPDVPDVENAVGPLLNTLPFPIEFETSQTVAEVLSCVNSRLLQMVESQWSAFEIMAKITGEKINAALQSVVVTEYDVPPPSQSAWTVDREDLMEFGLTLLIERKSQDGLKYSLNEFNRDLQARILFDSSQYTNSAVDGLVRHFKNALIGIMNRENTSVKDVRGQVMDETERTSMTEVPKAFDQASGVEPELKPPTIKHAFETCVSNWPEACAIEAPRGVRLSYREVEESANKVARRLRQLLQGRVCKDVVVGVLSDGSLHWVIAILAVLKAGCICCPIDVSLPRKRIESIVDQSSASLIIAANQACGNMVNSMGILPSIVVDQFLDTSPDCLQSPLPTVSQSTDVVYLVFTSGSTGTPKGVPLHNLSILNFLRTPEARLFSRPGRRISQLCALGFDMCLVELLASLLYGGTLVLNNPDDPFGNLKHVDAMVTTPSLLSAFVPEDYKNLDTVLLAGEPVSQALADTWANKVPTLLNFYGPSECGCVSSGTRLSPYQDVNIGRPISGLSIYILDHHQCLVPKGVTGEIYISGVQLIKGYWNAAKERGMASLFKENPYSTTPYDRVMYRTGDLGFWNDDMNISYVGRTDNMVKVRGFRVELEEVDAALVAAGGGSIKGAGAVAIGGHGPEDQLRIVGLVTPANVDLEALRLRLTHLLPHYARPAQVIGVSELPRAGNLKLDREKLKHTALASQGEPESQDATSREDHPGGVELSPTEHLVAETWKKLLRLPEHVRIRREDDFIALGGNSVMAIAVARHVMNAMHNKNVPLVLLLRETNLQDLAAAIDKAIAPLSPESPQEHLSFSSYSSAARSSEGPHPHSSSGALPLSYLEEEMFQAYKTSKVKSPFNTVVSLDVTGTVDTERLSTAFTSLVRHYPILRSRFMTFEGHGIRIIATKATPPLRLSGGQVDRGQLQGLVDEPFDLGKDQLLRVVLWEKDTVGKQLEIVLIAHHIITDKASWAVMLHWVSREYAHLTSEGDPATPNAAHGRQAATEPDKRTSDYLDWAQWLSQQKRVPSSLQKQERVQFWKDHLRAVPVIPQLQLQGRTDLAGCPGTTRCFHIGPPAEHAARYSQRIAVAATVLTLKDLFGTHDFVLGLPYVNRDDSATAEIVGFFLDRLPLRIRLDEKASHGPEYCTSVLEKISTEITLCLSNYLPYAEIQDAVGEMEGTQDHGRRRPVLMDAMVVYDWRSDSLEHSLSLGPGVDVTQSQHGLHPDGSLIPLLFGFLEERDGGLTVNITYNTDVVSDMQVNDIADRLEFMVDGFSSGSLPKTM